ncbi:hypothetical protein M2447_002773 [Ereboglobus sp. PH5-10]|uniref:hypothetical protein n=1 Tax=Ereboglobus sp. PH5-10 TaxID=2940629 RepID=UPI0024070F40|nr:hypothetical protein [Ereboglobus sp. PH5-10]MDF9828645.1 hypothetical protein [Ereboglobus sp. PH5-10]
MADGFVLKTAQMRISIDNDTFFSPRSSTTTAIYTDYGTVLTSGTYVATISNKYGLTYGNVTSSAVTVTVTTSGGNTGGNNNSSSGGGGGGGAPSFLYVAGLAIAGLLKRLAKR